MSAIMINDSELNKEVHEILLEIRSIKEKALRDEESLRQKLYAFATFFDSYWDLYTFVKKSTTDQEDFNVVMGLVRGRFLDGCFKKK